MPITIAALILMPINSSQSALRGILDQCRDFDRHGSREFWWVLMTCVDYISATDSFNNLILSLVSMLSIFQKSSCLQTWVELSMCWNWDEQDIFPAPQSQANVTKQALTWPTWKNEATWRCCEPTCKYHVLYTDLDQCNFWPWSTWPFIVAWYLN